MHRRARHLNPGSAGAVLALDSRFITGLSDGDPVSTWSDRSGSGNDATATSADRPTFKIGIRAGNSAVRFSGSNVMAGGLNASTSAMTVITAWVEDSASSQFDGIIVGHNNSGDDFSSINGFILTADDTGPTGPTRFAWGLQNTFLRPGTPTIEPWNILSAYRSGVNGNLSVNGFQIGSTASLTSGSGTSTNYVLGGRYLSGVSSSFRLHGDVGVMSWFAKALENPLRRRLEHAAAFAFKIPCS